MKKILLSATMSCLSIISFAQVSWTHTLRCSNSNSLSTGVIDVGGPCTPTSSQSLIVADWTSGGSPHIWRAYLKFDLSFIDPHATIDTAYLSFYANATSPSGNVGHPTWGTDNASKIYRITSSWDTTTLTWTTQPTTSSTNSISLPQSTSDIEDYVNLDATALIQDIITSGANNGILLRHVQETTPLNSMIFYTPAAYSVDSNKVPRLYVHWTAPLVVDNIDKNNLSVKVYPNPVQGQKVTVEVSGSRTSDYTCLLTDITGRIVPAQISFNTGKTEIETSLLEKGLYIIKVTDISGASTSTKLVVE